MSMSHLTPAAHTPPEFEHSLEVEAAEQKRWLTWFGTPALVAAVLVAIAFGTGEQWIIGPAVVAIIVDIGVLIWLTLSSDTNGVTGGPASSHH